MQNENQETSFRWFPKTQTKFRNNLVNKLGYCETHNLCYFNQTQEVHFFSKLKISPKQHFVGILFLKIYFLERGAINKYHVKIMF